MKIFSWVANKIGGKQEPKRSAANSTAPAYRGNVSECRNDEFSDWPQSLLAIGTFGNKQLEEEVAESSSANVQTIQDPAKFTEEEVDNLRREFEVLLLQGNGQAEAQGSCEDVQVASKQHDGEDNNEKQRREQLMNREMIISEAREIVGKKKSAKLKPRLMASLLRLLACKGGFTTPVLEPRNSFPQTRMEKLLKAILQKKIHPQNSNTVATRRRLDWKLDEKEINECLEDALRDLDDDDDGAKWVKTDSDFIVLEM
ncbi:protein DEEPER ROOTING 1-like [Miscanthus floridulus]|uniref:protein DEEPER ROOTING 1-like n=1 Tax=Miscanthus floridulus TaxID=154761 RepID=UPI003458195B